MTLLNFGWNGGLLLLPLLGLGISMYCFIRYFKKKLIIPLVVGGLLFVLSVWGLIAMINDK